MLLAVPSDPASLLFMLSRLKLYLMLKPAWQVRTACRHSIGHKRARGYSHVHGQLMLLKIRIPQESLVQRIWLSAADC